MKTQCVSFQGGLNIHSTVTPEVRQAIKKSPALRRFGMLYSASVSQIRLGSHSKMNVIYSGLSIDNIKPRNIFVALYDFVTGRSVKRYDGLNFSSGKETDKGLIEVLGQMRKNSFLKMIMQNKS